MSLAEAFAPAEEHYKNVVKHNVWGHLFPKQPQYRGKLRIALPTYGGDCGIILETNLPPASPWWFDAITNFAFEVGKDIEYGEVVEFDIQVDIVECADEESPGDTWIRSTSTVHTEIHIKQLAKTTLLKE